MSCIARNEMLDAAPRLPRGSVLRMGNYLNLMCAALATIFLAVGIPAPSRAESHRESRPQLAQSESGRSAFRGFHHDRRSFDERPPRFHGHRDSMTSGSPGAGYRQALMDDLKEHVPLLYEQMQAVFAIQQERQELQGQKRDAARNPERSEIKLQRFHELVRRDDALTSRQRGLLAETAAQAEPIRVQAVLRRSELEARLQELDLTEKRGAVQDKDAHTSEVRFLTRAIRSYGYIDMRLASLQNNPRNPEWMRPLLKGMFHTGEEPDLNTNTREWRLRQLREEEEDLRRRLQRIQREIESLSGKSSGDEKRQFWPRTRPDGGDRGEHPMKHPDSPI